MVSQPNARQFTWEFTSTAANGRAFSVGFSQESAEYAFGIAPTTVPAVGTNTYIGFPLAAADTAVTGALVAQYRELYSLSAEAKAARPNQPGSPFGIVLQGLRISTDLANFNNKSIYVVENTSSSSTFTVNPMPLSRYVAPNNFQLAVADVPMNRFLNANLAIIFFAGVTTAATTETHTITAYLSDYVNAPTQR